MPIDTLVQTVSQVVKQPPPIQGAKKVGNHVVMINKILQRLAHMVVDSDPLYIIELHNEFKTLLGDKIKGRTFIFISLFSLILFNNFLGLFPFIFTRTRHLTSGFWHNTVL
jgi:hypothetical protein